MSPFAQDADMTLWHGDALAVLRGLPEGSASCCVTSPPYLDARPEYPSPTLPEFREIFAELRRVVVADGPLLLNVGRLWRHGVERLWWTDLIEVASAEGWLLLDTLVWAKRNANPIHGRLFADKHEYVFVLGDPAGVVVNVDEIRSPYAEESLARLERGWSNHTGVKNDTGRRVGRRVSQPHPLGARPSSYVEFCTGREKGNPHPAPMAIDFAEYLVRFASWPGQTILDPFAGSGNTLLAARKHGRCSVGIELSEDYCALIARRTQQLPLEAA